MTVSNKLCVSVTAISALPSARTDARFITWSPSPSSPRLVTVELGGCSDLRKKDRFCGLTQNRGLMMGTAAYLVALALVEGAGRFKRSR